MSARGMRTPSSSSSGGTPRAAAELSEPLAAVHRAVDALVAEAQRASLQRLDAERAEAEGGDGEHESGHEGEGDEQPWAPLAAGCCACCADGGGEDDKEVSLAFGDPGAEKLTADLEQRAALEAESLVAADGTICKERLALMRRTFDKAFVSRVLARAPFEALMGLPEKDWDSEAMNTALLLEDFREIRSWQEAAPATRALFPMRLLPLFGSGPAGGLGLDLDDKLAFVQSRLLGEDFWEAHPKLQTSKVVGAAGRTSSRPLVQGMANFDEFKSLLRSFSGGILEGLPFGKDTLVLGGSALPWCVRPLTGRQRALCRRELRAAEFEAALRRGLARRLGSVACAERIVWMAGCTVKDVESDERRPESDEIAVSAGAVRQLICKEFKGDAWEDADIDLFVLADSAEATVRSAVGVLQRNIDARGGGRESVVLRTKNTLTVVGGAPFLNVQVVCKTVRSVQELLVHSDVDCTSMAFDGETVWASTRALRALACGFNFLPKQLLTGHGPRISRSLARFSKYYHRGFGVLVFEHCRHVPRCDHGVPPGSFQRLAKMRAPKEPGNLRGSPEKKGETLAKWMLSCSAQLRQKVAAKDDGPGAPADLGDGADLLAHRVVPGDRLAAGGGSGRAGKGEGKGKGKEEGGGPFRNYGNFMDILIPCGPGVCANTLRAYVKRLGCPDLLQEVAGAEVTIVPKTGSDRKQWQDHARGKCYMCKVAMRTRQPWPLCQACARFNERKRAQLRADADRDELRGLVAVVTGGRVKIGREAAVGLLRAGATVVVTTRFPRDALERYKQEPDYASFGDRLLVLAADFRRLPSVQRVVDFVLGRFDRLDVLVHNAAQTVRRPPAYYESLVKREKELEKLADNAEEKDDDSEEPGFAECGVVEDALALLPVPTGLPVLASDAEAERRKAEWFPAGATDAHGDQLDLREATSWTMKLEDTEMTELAEVLAVNLVVPYLLTARWLPLLRKAPAAFVVFVSSQEGTFSAPNGHKNSAHPHTNAAKAGLNMLARTIAGDLRRDSVFVSAVDPGWVSWMKPGGSQAVEAAPLTEADGAARVLDPVFSGFEALKNRRCPPSGVLFKDFRVAPW